MKAIEFTEGYTFAAPIKKNKETYANSIKKLEKVVKPKSK